MCLCVLCSMFFYKSYYCTVTYFYKVTFQQTLCIMIIFSIKKNFCENKETLLIYYCSVK